MNTSSLLQFAGQSNTMIDDIEAGYLAYLDELALEQKPAKSVNWQSGWLEGMYEQSCIRNDNFIATVHDAAEALPATEPDFITPDMLGELDAQEGAPFAPEVYYADRIKQALYAAGWATVKGPSYLTDPFLVGSTSPALEDDYDFIREGGA